MYYSQQPFQLDNHEILLMEIKCRINWPKDAPSSFARKKTECKVQLSDQGLILAGTIYHLFGTTEKIYAYLGLDQIKKHEQMPLIKRKDSKVELQLIAQPEPLVLDLGDDMEAFKFANRMIDQITHTTTLQRNLEGAGKVAADAVFGFMQAAGGVFNAALKGLQQGNPGSGKTGPKRENTSFSAHSSSSKSSSASSSSASAESLLKDLRKLREAGILSQDEYEQKREEVLKKAGY